MSLPNRPGTGKPVSGSDVTEEGRLSRRAWLLSALAVIVVLPAASLGLAVALADPNDSKPEIEAAVQRATGRALSLDGPIRITCSLDPWIEVSQVRLANLPGGSRSYMVRVDKIRAQVSLLALLWQRIEVTHLELTGPNILLEEVKGQPNGSGANSQYSAST
jgi:AsmA protein